MSKTLAMNFLNEAGNKVAIRVNNVREDLSDLDVSAAMDLIIAKNIFSSTGGDLKNKYSAEVIDKSTTELSVK